MKILGISFLVMILLLGFSSGLDYFRGLDLTTSIKNNLNPFMVMEVGEMAVFSFMILVPMVLAFRKRRKSVGEDKN